MPKGIGRPLPRFGITRAQREAIRTNLWSVPALMVAAIVVLFVATYEMDLAAADRLPTLGDLKLKSSFRAELKGIPIGWYIQVSDWSKTGVTGSPFGASAERGQKIFARTCDMVKEVVSFLAKKELDG